MAVKRGLPFIIIGAFIILLGILGFLIPLIYMYTWGTPMYVAFLVGSILILIGIYRTVGRDRAQGTFLIVAGICVVSVYLIALIVSSGPTLFTIYFLYRLQYSLPVLILIIVVASILIHSGFRKRNKPKPINNSI